MFFEYILYSKNIIFNFQFSIFKTIISGNNCDYGEEQLFFDDKNPFPRPLPSKRAGGNYSLFFLRNIFILILVKITSGIMSTISGFMYRKFREMEKLFL